MAHESNLLIVGDATASESVAPSVVHAPRRPSRSDGSSTFWLAVSDASAFVVAMLVMVQPAASVTVVAGLAAGALAAVAVMAAFRLYAPAAISAAEETRRIAGAGCVMLVLSAVVADFGESVSAGDAIAGWALVTGLLVGERSLWRWRRRRALAAADAVNALILADAVRAVQVDEAIDRGSGRIRPVGVLYGRSGRFMEGASVLGSIDDLETVAVAHAASCVIVVATCFEQDEMLQILRAARENGLEVLVFTAVPAMAAGRLRVDRLGDTMSLSVSLPRLTPLQAGVKRAFDIVASSLLLVLFAVPMAVTAAAVRLTSSGGAVFRQTRVTIDDRSFTMFKFRTMVRGATSTSAPAAEDRSALFFKTGEDDPRITRIGHFLRRTSLDELPQLWNVLRGDMSLVGPRPLPVEQVRAHEALLGSRHAVRAGISGWWQVNGRSSLSPTASVEMDLYYIDNWSLWLDCTILARTFGAVLSQRGAG